MKTTACRRWQRHLRRMSELPRTWRNCSQRIASCIGGAERGLVHRGRENIYSSEFGEGDSRTLVAINADGELNATATFVEGAADFSPEAIIPWRMLSAYRSKSAAHRSYFAWRRPAAPRDQAPSPFLPWPATCFNTRNTAGSRDWSFPFIPGNSDFMVGYALSSRSVRPIAKPSLAMPWRSLAALTSTRHHFQGSHRACFRGLPRRFRRWS